MLIPREVCFDVDDKAICAGVACQTEYKAARRAVVNLYSDGNVEFIDMDVRGKTERELIHEAHERERHRQFLNYLEMYRGYIQRCIEDSRWDNWMRPKPFEEWYRDDAIK